MICQQGSYFSSTFPQFKKQYIFLTLHVNRKKPLVWLNELYDKKKKIVFLIKTNFYFSFAVDIINNKVTKAKKY